MKCQNLVDDYLLWLRDRIKVVDIDEHCEITTPFLDRHNDHLQIYVTPTNGGLRISDDSYILSDLKSCGCNIDTQSRKRILETLLNGFGVRHKNDELYIEASENTFPQKKHSLLQAMLAVNDMFMTAKPWVATLFLEDVANFFDEHEVRYTPNVEFTGKTGFTHKFDFVIPKSKERPERLLRAINDPAKASVSSTLFAWEDTKNVRPPDSQCYVLLNDMNKKINQDLISAFQEYRVRPILWSERQDNIPELAL